MEYHNPVMLNEAVDGLNIDSEGYFIDATFGGGGHSKEILKRLSRGKLIAFDKDIAALKNKIDNRSISKIAYPNFYDVDYKIGQQEFNLNKWLDVVHNKVEHHN